MGKSKSPMQLMKTKVDMKKYVLSGKHWSELKFFDNMLVDALTKHILGLIRYGMSDPGEIMETLGQMKSTSEQDWANAWGNTAKKVHTQADIAFKNDKMVSASSSYLRAASYWRFALMNFSEYKDPKVVEFTKNSRYCYDQYLEVSGYPGKKVRIPYDTGYLPGYFYRSQVAKESAPIIVITPGRDTWGEDTVWVYDEALKRGIHCLVVEGPGQGTALRLQGLTYRKDWEAVITPALDFVETLPGIDMHRVALFGISFGGYLVPRAAAFENRVKLCITNPGNISWGASITTAFKKIRKLPKFLRPKMIQGLVRDYAWKHNVANNLDAVITELEQYNNQDIIEKLSCKVLVIDATAEILPGEALKFYNALKCSKHYMLFDEHSTAQNHTQMGGYGPASERIFDWILDNL